MISTHALREEGDMSLKPAIGLRYYISTHALREEGDMGHFDGFQPLDISTHALREEGDASGAFFGASDSISTHALREEGDYSNVLRKIRDLYFYPRPPRGGRRQMCRKIKAIFWQHLYNEIQLTKKAGCICAGCTVFGAQPACLSKTDRCEAAGDFLFAVPSHQSSALLTVYHKWVR